MFLEPGRARCSSNTAFVVKMGLVAARRPERDRLSPARRAGGRRPVRAGPDRAVAGAMGRRHLLRPLDRLQIATTPSPQLKGIRMQRRTLLAFAAAGFAPALAPRPPRLERLRPGPADLSRGQGRERGLEEPACRADAASEPRPGPAGRPGAGARCRPQSASVDAAKVLAATRLPTRKDPVWELELAPLTRMEAWKVAEIKNGQHDRRRSATPSRPRRARR